MNTDSKQTLNQYPFEQQKNKMRLAIYEAKIGKGIKDVGIALVAIRDKKLYKLEHKTFEAYCQKRWGLTRRYADLLIAAQQTRQNLRTAVLKDEIPTRERHLREVAKAPREKQAEVVKTANRTAKSENRDPTAKDYREAAKPYVETQSTPAKSKSTPVDLKPGQQKVSSAQIVDAFYKAHYPPLVRGIDAAAEALGGKGPNHQQANEALDSFSQAVNKMREGKR